jgi:8-oxo-dGTP diphosphatase
MITAPSDRTYPARPILGVGGVALSGNRVLLVKRGHEPLKGQWSLPGGVLEVGETLQVAVAREMLEETGLDVEVGALVDVVERIGRDEAGRVEYHYVIADYLCVVRGGTLACASDADAAEWAALDDLDRYGVGELARRVITKAMSMARSG